MSLRKPKAATTLLKAHPQVFSNMDAFRKIGMFAIALMMVASSASASSINLGYVIFTSFIPGGGSNTFDVGNFSGKLLLGTDFPLFDPVVFTQLHLTVDAGAGLQQFTLDDLGPGNLTIESGAPPLDLQLLTEASFGSVGLDAQIAVKDYLLQDLGIDSPCSANPAACIFTPFASGISVAFNLTNGVVADGEIAVIVAEGTFSSPAGQSPAPVPEPATLVSVGTCLAAAIRSYKRKKANA